MAFRPTFLGIDLLRDMFERHPLLEARRAELVRAVNELTAAFREACRPIVWVNQQFAPDLRDAFLDMRDHNRRVTIAGTSGASLLPELALASTDIVLIKKRYSAFFGTELDRLLEDQQPSHLVVAGVNTHACVRTTVIDAYQRDYRVMVAADAVASYDQQHHDVSQRYLDGKMASFLSNQTILQHLRGAG